MKKLILLLTVLLVGSCNSTQQSTPQPTTVADSSHHHSASPSAATASAKPTPDLPAFFKNAESLPQPLPPTLPPEKFTNEQIKKAYQVAREIPATLAQLPCFCYCDKGFGHKSLHSCYEDDHSAGCSTCIDEALMAYNLQIEQGQSVEQVRNTIIARFGSPN